MLLENNPYPQDVRVRGEAESLASAGYRVEVVAPRASGQPRRETINGVVVRRFRGAEASAPGVSAILREYAVAAVALHLAAVRALLRGARVLHIHNPPDIFFCAGALFRLAGRRVIFDHHDLGPELVEAKFARRPLVALARAVEWLTFAVASHVLAANESHAEVARRRGAKAPQAVTVVRNGPPAAWLELPASGREGALSEVHLAYVGAVAVQDGVQEMAAVLAALPSELSAHLTVIGDGDARPVVETALRAAGVSDRVTFTGWVGPEEVPALVQAADICVDPAPASPLNERSTMIKVAEYLALGKPVVAYDLLETRRTLAGAGVTVPPGDVEAFAAAIEQIARDGELRASLARQARERARQLTWELSAAALLEAYARPSGSALAEAVVG